MKLLRDFIRLRAAGRRLLSGRRDARGRSYAVTVPPPLRRNVSELNRPDVPSTSNARLSGDTTSPRHLCLISSH
ncbi:MAG TPA: hypothetical protein VIM06_06395 [Rhodanobacter sp.]